MEGERAVDGCEGGVQAEGGGEGGVAGGRRLDGKLDQVVKKGSYTSVDRSGKRTRREGGGEGSNVLKGMASVCR
jgi:hypothetical protein